MYIVADIGSTNTRIAGSRGDDQLTEPVIVPTPLSYTDGLAHIIATARAIVGGEKIESVAIGLPARLNPDRRSIFKVRYLPDWDGKEIAKDIESALSAPVLLENDTMQVGLGEAVYGAGKGASIVVYMTVSTGVNAVRIVNGIIEPYAYGYETGFQYIQSGEDNKDLVALGSLIAGSAVCKRFNVASPRDLDKDHPVWEEMARYAAIGLHNTVVHWSPERVVLGGSMFKEVGISVERVEAHLRDIMQAFPTIPEIKRSGLGDIGGLYGGLARLSTEPN